MKSTASAPIGVKWIIGKFFRMGLAYLMGLQLFVLLHMCWEAHKCFDFIAKYLPDKIDNLWMPVSLCYFLIFIKTAVADALFKFLLDAQSNYKLYITSSVVSALLWLSMTTIAISLGLNEHFNLEEHFYLHSHVIVLIILNYAVSAILIVVLGKLIVDVLTEKMDCGARWFHNFPTEEMPQGVPDAQTH